MLKQDSKFLTIVQEVLAFSLGPNYFLVQLLLLLLFLLKMAGLELAGQSDGAASLFTCGTASASDSVLLRTKMSLPGSL